MFDVIKGKLSEVEGKVRGVIAQVTGDVAAAEAQVHQIGTGALTPLDKVQASVAQARGGVTQAVAPVRQRLGTLAPPGG
jgi:hypothetical protein